MIRILLVDDHPIFRFGIRAFLEATSDMAVVGEAGTGEEAVRLCAELHPDVVLMDMVMPVMGGVETTRQILRIQPDATVLIVTMLDDDGVLEAIRAGARGYLNKGASHEETLRAIRTIAEGGAIFSPGAAERLLRYFNPKSAAAPPLPELTPRERDLLDLIARGFTNPEIAERLGLSVKTVRNQVSLLCTKLQVKRRTEAIVRAREAGLGLR